MNVSPGDILAARQGDETAQAAIITGMMPLIRRLARANLVQGLEEDDAVQEGLIALFHAIDTFENDKDASFTTYAVSCIRNGIADARIRASRKKHQPLNQSVPLDETQLSPGPEEQALNNESYRTTVRVIRTSLSAAERRALVLYLDGADYQTIARRMGVSVKAVDNALTRVRTKLRNKRQLLF